MGHRPYNCPCRIVGAAPKGHPLPVPYADRPGEDGGPRRRSSPPVSQILTVYLAILTGYGCSPRRTRSIRSWVSAEGVALSSVKALVRVSNWRKAWLRLP